MVRVFFITFSNCPGANYVQSEMVVILWGCALSELILRSTLCYSTLKPLLPKAASPWL
jgi:hypothetical protein